MDFYITTDKSRVPVSCETKYTETKRNLPKPNEIDAKRNGIIQNEIKPILTKQFLLERQHKN